MFELYRFAKVPKKLILLNLQKSILQEKKQKVQIKLIRV